MKKILPAIIVFCLLMQIIFAGSMSAFASDSAELTAPITATVNAEDSTAAATVGPFVVGGGVSGTDYTWNDSVLEITTDTPLTISMSTTGSTSAGILISASNAQVTLQDINIHVTGSTLSPVEVSSSASISLKGSNTIMCDGKRAAIRVPASARLTLDGSGSLYVRGGRYGAAIGGNGYGWMEAGGNITINGGTITAEHASGNSFGAAIGGGGYPNDAGKSCGTITINGGTVTCRTQGSAAIGGAYGARGCDVIINGGSVNAVSVGGNAIGNGWYWEGLYGGTLTMNGGHVEINNTSAHITMNGGEISASGGNYSSTPSPAFTGSITMKNGVLTAVSEKAAISAAVTLAPEIGYAIEVESGSSLEDLSYFLSCAEETSFAEGENDYTAGELPAKAYRMRAVQLEDDPTTTPDPEVMLAAPQNPVWKEGSTATAAWDPVEEADYYHLNVHVYHDGTELGIAETGTSLTEVDVQQQVNRVIRNSGYSSVQLAYTVQAGVTSTDGTISYGPESILSQEWTYTPMLVQLYPPETVVLNEDGTASWNSVDGTYRYFVEAYSYTGETYNTYAGNAYCGVYAKNVSEENGMISYDLSEICEGAYHSALTNNKIMNGDTVGIRIQIKCIAEDTSNYVDSAYSAYSNTIEYVSTELVKLDPPQTVELSTDCMASWNSVPGAYRYFIEAYSYTGEAYNNYAGNAYCSVYANNVTEENGMISYDLSQICEDTYRAALTNKKIENGDTVGIRIQIKCLAADGSQYVDSAFSDYSNTIEYTATLLLQLEAPETVILNEDCTANWNAVDGTDYYWAALYAYSDQECTELAGSSFKILYTSQATVEDGMITCDLSDNFEEAYKSTISAGSIQNGDILWYRLQIKCFAADDSIYVDSFYSEDSDPVAYVSSELIQLQPPETVILNEDCTANWNAVDGTDYYWAALYAYSDQECTELAGSSFKILYTSQATVEDGMITCDLSDNFEEAYKSAISAGSIQNGDILWYRLQIKCFAADDSIYVDSFYSEDSDPVAYVSSELIQLQPPETVILNEDCTANWNAVDGTDYYWAALYAYSDQECTELAGSSFKILYTSQATVEGGMITCDLSDNFEEAYKSAISAGSIQNGDILWYRLQIKCFAADDSIYVDSFYSEDSDPVAYVPTYLIPMDPPETVILNDDCTAVWNSVEGTYRYFIEAYGYTGKEHNIYAGNAYRGVYVRDLTVENGIISFDLSDICEGAYKSAMTNGKIESGDSLGIRIQIKCIAAEGTPYVDSPYSDYSNTIVYTPRTPVESFTLSPAEPVVYVGNSYHLGITITPEDAYYSSVDWSTTDAATVTVDGTGLITGVAAGGAEITAVIGDADCTVPVMVYDISSNIEDNEDREEVKDTAGDIIDDLVNKDNPDLGNTDITEDEREEIRDEVQDGIWRGDEFFTDMNWYDREFGAYKNNWGQIQKAARLLNAQFAGAYNIEVEMYHKEKDGSTIHPIGCIEEFENDISFAFDLPTGMDEIRDGYARKYVLVRIHRNEIDTVDFEHADGKGKGKSKHFSDFVLLYVDTPTEPVDLSGLSTLTLPASVVSVETEAFAGTAAEVLVIPEGCRNIGSRAFADCPNLRYIVVPTDWDITPANDAFDGCTAEILYR